MAMQVGELRRHPSGEPYEACRAISTPWSQVSDRTSCSGSRLHVPFADIDQLLPLVAASSTYATHGPDGNQLQRHIADGYKIPTVCGQVVLVTWQNCA